MPKSQQTLSPVAALAHYWTRLAQRRTNREGWGGGRETGAYRFTKRKRQRDRESREEKKNKCSL